MAEQPARAAPPPRQQPKADGGKLLGMPKPVAIGVLAGAAVLLFLWWRSRQAAQQQSSQGGGQPVATPTIVDVFQEWQGHQPHRDRDGREHDHPHPDGQHYEVITISRAMTFGQLAKDWHWAPRVVTAIEEANRQQGRGEITLSTELHPGQTILVPVSA